jgi:hypothetical protein
MSAPETNWRTHTLEAIGLNMPIYEAWALQTMQDGPNTNVFQQIDDLIGVLFVRYGPDETLDAFIDSLAEARTSIDVQRDEPAVVSGQPARRVALTRIRHSVRVYRETLRYDAETGKHVPDLVDGMTSEERTTMRVTGLEHRGVPILFGYRLPEEEVPKYAPILEQFVDGVELVE